MVITLVGRPGLEPGTNGLKGHCSTDWATDPQQLYTSTVGVLNRQSSTSSEQIPKQFQKFGNYLNFQKRKNLVFLSFFELKNSKFDLNIRIDLFNAKLLWTKILQSHHYWNFWRKFINQYPSIPLVHPPTTFPN